MKLFDQFCKEKQYLHGTSPLTIKSYRQAFDRFVNSGGTKINKESLSQYVIWMRERGLKATTCNISIRAFNTFLSWLYENEHTKERLRIKQIKTEKKVIEPYSDAEIKKILSFKPKDYYEWRLYTLSCLLIDTGTRIQECLTLTRDNVDLDNQLIRVRGKGNKERIIPISFECRKILYKFLDRHEDKMVFPTLTGNKLSYRNILREWRAFCKRIGIGYRPFHQLRHNFGLNFIREGGDISELRRLLGHSSITTTQLYVSLQTEDLKRAHAKTSILSRLK
jgi:integrase/recombinase XerD